MIDNDALFFREMNSLLDGLVNAPPRLVNHLLSHKEATLEELRALYDTEYESQSFVEVWLRRMITHFAVERFWYPETDRHTYQLTPFAKDTIKHIKNFRVVNKL